MTVGMAWIGSMGFTRYYIYFYPLINLGYLFGYNQQIDGEDGLFAYVNYGFLIFVAPLLVFAVVMIIGKIKQSYAP